MQKRKSFRPSPIALVALATLFVTSCNRGVGCPANNMSIEENLFDLLGGLLAVLF